MRKTINPQPNLREPWLELEHARKLETISSLLDAHPKLNELVLQDLKSVTPSAGSDVGRGGMSAEQVLRALLVKQLNQFSYRELAFHLADSRSYRTFCQLGIIEPTPSKSTLAANIKAVKFETLEQINRELVSVAEDAGIEKGRKVRVDCTKAAFFPNFFKTGPGEYGEGDRFHGVTVPKCRKIAKAARGMKSSEISKLLTSPMHEEREVALFILVDAFNRATSDKHRDDVYRFYVRHLRRVNNWDLVDGSAPTIVGGYLEDKDRSQLYDWAKSKDLWERRIAMLATFRFIKQKDFKDALAIAKLLRDDEEDLIHKAVGWMLREVGNRDLAVEERFLKTHYKRMPRTMLRYAIEKFPEKKRQAYLKGTV